MAGLVEVAEIETETPIACIMHSYTHTLGSTPFSLTPSSRYTAINIIAPSPSPRHSESDSHATCYMSCRKAQHLPSKKVDKCVNQETKEAR